MIKKLLFKSFVALSLGLITSIFSLAYGQVSVQNASGPAACDGSAMLLDSNAVLNSISWQGNGAVIATATFSIGNLCPGTYSVTYDSPNTMTFTFTVSGVNCNGLTAITTSTDATDSLTCDGSVSATVTGGTAPYTYTWSNGANTISQNNLCTSSYTCLVTDSNGCTDTDVATVGVINGGGTPNDSTLIFVNNNFPGVPVAASYTATIEDCNLPYDYVTGATITNTTILNPGNILTMDSVIVTWTLVDSTNAVLANYTVLYLVSDSINGVIEFTLVVSCGQKALQYNTVQASDRVMHSSLNLVENSSVFSVVNPMNDQLQVRFASPASGSLILVDGLGKTIARTTLNQQSDVSIPVNHLSHGAYFLHMNLNGEYSTVKMVK